MKNITFSKTFSFIVVLILSAYFLFPNIIASINLYQIEKSENDIRKTFNDETAKRADLIKASFHSLRLKDNNLKQCIKDELKIYMGIHPSSSGGINSVRELKYLKCPGRNIASLDGIQELADLVLLDLSSNDVKDITPLLSLKKLQTIYLDGNKPTNPELIFEISSLRRVVLPDLSDMYCADIAALMKSAKFQSASNADSMFECIGSGNSLNDIDLLYAKKRSGVELTHEEEIRILQFETNQKKAEYNRKKEAYSKKYNQ